MTRAERFFSVTGWLFIALCAVEGLTLTAYLAYRAEHDSPELLPPCVATKGDK